MLRYIALICNQRDEASVREAASLASRIHSEGSWTRAFAGRGIRVFVTGSRSGASEVYSLGNQGVVLGKLFAREQDGSRDVPTQFTASDRHEIASSGGRKLVSDFWGQYVAFLCDDKAIRVLRAPCGSLPCYATRTSSEKVQLYCSWIEDLGVIGVGRRTVNVAVFLAVLSGAIPDMRATCLQGLTQLLGGECASHSNSETKYSFYWDPLRAEEITVDMVGAASLLRECVVDSAHAWCRCDEESLETSSGGLDSSIVLSSRKRSSLKRTRLINYFLDNSDSDERPFFRRMIGHLGIEAEVIERQRDPHLKLDGLMAMHRMPFPSLCLHSLETSQWEAELSAQVGATAIWTGNGGDQVFYTGPGTPCAASYLRRKGLKATLGCLVSEAVSRTGETNAWSVLLDAAQLDKLSVPRVLQEIREQANQPYQGLFGMQLGKYRTLIDPEIVSHLRRALPLWLHPMLRDCDGIDPARLLHAEQVLAPDDCYDIFCGPNYPDRRSPILSQRVVELCLRLPRDLLIRGGWTRSVARRAFQYDLPCEIVTRRDKGSVGEQYRKIVLCDDFGKSLLLDGELARQKIIDRKATENWFSSNPSQGSTDPVEVAILMCAEGWLQKSL